MYEMMHIEMNVAVCKTLIMVLIFISLILLLYLQYHVVLTHIFKVQVIKV